MIAYGNDARMSVQEALEEPKRMVQEYPMSAMLVVFGVGLGVGFVIGQAACAPLAQWTQHEPSMREKLGHSVLEAIRSLLPESIGRSLAA